MNDTIQRMLLFLAKLSRKKEHFATDKLFQYLANGSTYLLN